MTKQSMFIAKQLQSNLLSNVIEMTKQWDAYCKIVA
jgi:hypothetical protein